MVEADEGAFVGRVAGLRDVVTFEAALSARGIERLVSRIPAISAMTAAIPVLIVLIYAILKISPMLMAPSTITIEPIVVSESLNEQGYTPEVVATELMTRIQFIYQSTYSARKGHDLYARWKEPDIKVPGTGLSVAAIVTSLRSILPVVHTDISGHILEYSNRNIQLRLIIANTGRLMTLTETSSGGSFENIDTVIDKAAAQVVKRIEPHMYALFALSSGHDDAIEEIAKLVHINTSDKDAWWYYFHGVLAADAGEIGAAITYFDKSIEIDNANIDAMNDWAVVLSDNNMYSLAMDKLRSAIKLAPANALLKANLADHLISVGDTSAAEEQIMELLALNQDYESAWLAHGHLLYRRGEIDKAEELFNRLTQTYPSNRRNWLV